MTLFVLGILVGWALEYVAFNYWWKDKVNARNGSSSERTDYEARLAAKDREIALLQQKLQSAADDDSSAQAAPVEEKAKPVEVAKEPEPEAKAPAKPAPVKKAKPASKKKAPAKKKAAPKKKAAAKTEKAAPISLKDVAGVGPKTEEALKVAGLGDAASLAAASEDAVKAALEKAGARAGNISSWIEQAKLLAAGDLDGLKKLKETL